MKPLIKEILAIIVMIVSMVLIIIGTTEGAHVQHPGNIALYGVVMDPARAQLMAAWNDNDPNQNERGYCVSEYSVARSHPDSSGNYEILVRVWKIKKAAVDSASHDWIMFECPVGYPMLHVHPPATCYANSCTLGGIEAYDTDPSRDDLQTLVSRGDGFAVIQMAREGFRFYYPDDLRQSPAMDSVLYHPVGK